MTSLLEKRAKQANSGIYIAWRSLIYKINIYNKGLLWKKEIAGLGSSLIVEKKIIYALSITTGVQL